MLHTFPRLTPVFAVCDIKLKEAEKTLEQECNMHAILQVVALLVVV